MVFRPLILLVPLLWACDPCHQSCKAQVAAYEECMVEWNLTWEELGAVDADAWSDQCMDDMDQLRSRPDDKSVVDQCRRDEARYVSNASCQELGQP